MTADALSDEDIINTSVPGLQMVSNENQDMLLGFRSAFPGVRSAMQAWRTGDMHALRCQHHLTNCPFPPYLHHLCTPPLPTFPCTQLASDLLAPLCPFVCAPLSTVTPTPYANACDPAQVLPVPTMRHILTPRPSPCEWAL